MKAQVDQLNKAGLNVIAKLVLERKKGRENKRLLAKPTSTIGLITHFMFLYCRQSNCQTFAHFCRFKFTLRAYYVILVDISVM